MRKEKSSVAFQNIENAVTDWGEHLRWTARGWDCIEEYTCDLLERENLGNDLTDYGGKELPDKLQQRIARAGQTLRELTYEANRCAWGDVRNYDPKLYWYYYRWTSSHSEHFCPGIAEIGGMKMAVSQETRKALYERAGGQCECTMTVCSHHKGRCPHKLNPGWEAHHRTAGGPDTLSNLTAMCVTCHKNTRTYGRG